MGARGAGPRRPLTLMQVALAAALAALVPTAPEVPITRPPGLIALVEEWAQSTPVSGLRCSGVLLGSGELLTAGHCLSERPASIVVGSLCEPVSGRSPMLAMAGFRGVRKPAPNDAAVVEVPDMTPSILVDHAQPTSGRAVVWGYGVDQAVGRPECEPSAYNGSLVRCGMGRCLQAARETQLCGGSSGAPVFVETASGWALTGVVSGGPRCGHPGLVVIADIPKDHRAPGR